MFVGCREVDDYPKALYRRGMTHALLNNYAEAEEHLLRAKEVGFPRHLAPFSRFHSLPLTQVYWLMPEPRKG
jgi:hypothetical protein